MSPDHIHNTTSAKEQELGVSGSRRRHGWDPAAKGPASIRDTGENAFDEHDGGIGMTENGICRLASQPLCTSMISTLGVGSAV